MCLERLLGLALEHDTCATEKARLEGDAIVIPFDAHHRDTNSWTIEYERVHNRRELLDALGY
jgi:hypothetical protein